MTTFEVVKAEERKRFPSKHGGEMVVYSVELKDGESYVTAELLQKPETPAPAEGDRLEGSIEPSQFGMKFRKSLPPGGGSKGGGKANDYRTPEQIMRGYAHTHALRYWELKHAADPEFAFASWGDYTQIVQLFYEDIVGAAKP